MRNSFGNTGPYVTAQQVAALRAARNTTFPEGFVPTRLYAKNAMVAACNEASYEQLKAENAAAGGGTEGAYAPKYPNARSREWGANTGYDAPIAPLPGAQVMVAWNVSPDSGIINGTRGRVVTLREIEGATKGVVVVAAHPLVYRPVLRVRDPHDAVLVRPPGYQEGAGEAPFREGLPDDAGDVCGRR